MNRALVRLAIAATAAAVAVGVFAADTDDYETNTAVVKGWLRTHLMVDEETGTFSNTNMPNLAQSAAAAQVAEQIPAMMQEANDLLTNKLAGTEARLDEQADRPVVMITGAANLDNLLDRTNLTFAVVTNWWTDTDTARHLDCMVFGNRIFATAPIMTASLISNMDSVTNYITGVWDNYGKTASEQDVTITHDWAYSNFVIAAAVPASGTYTETDTIAYITTQDVREETRAEGVTGTRTATTNRVAVTLTNQTLQIIDGGAEAQVINGHDEETFECWKLSFDLPKGTKVHTRVNPWIVTGADNAAFDFGNRQLRLNGVLCTITNDCSYLGTFMTTNGTAITELTPYIDNGLLRFAEPETPAAE